MRICSLLESTNRRYPTAVSHIDAQEQGVRHQQAEELLQFIMLRSGQLSSGANARESAVVERKRGYTKFSNTTSEL